MSKMNPLENISQKYVKKIRELNHWYWEEGLIDAAFVYAITSDPSIHPAGYVHS